LYEGGECYFAKLIFLQTNKNDSRDASSVIVKKVRREVCSGDGIGAKEHYLEPMVCPKDRN